MNHCKHGFIDQGKYRKVANKRKWKDREYHVQDNADVSHKDVKVYCDTKQLPSLPFCGLHSKTHGARGLIKYDQLRFYPKLGHGICAIHHITCACVVCTSNMDKPWFSGIPSKKQACYKNVTKFTYCPLLGSYNNWNIIELTPKSTPFEAFDEITQVVIDGISENMALLVQSGMFGAINIDETTDNRFYVVQFISEEYATK